MIYILFQVMDNYNFMINTLKFVRHKHLIVILFHIHI